MKSKSSVRFASIEPVTSTAPQHLYNDDLPKLRYQKAELEQIKNAAKYELIRFKRNCVNSKHNQHVSIRGLEYRTSKSRQQKRLTTVKYVVGSQSILKNSSTNDITLQLATISLKLTNYAKSKAINDAALDTLAVYNLFDGYVERSQSIIKSKEANSTLGNKELKRKPLKLVDMDGFVNNIEDRPMKRSRAA